MPIKYRKQFRIGRGRLCEVRINDKTNTVSEFHATIMVSNNHFELPKIVDNNSTNGLFLKRNNTQFHQVKDCFIKPKDIFRFGKYHQVSATNIYKSIGFKYKNRQELNLKRRRAANGAPKHSPQIVITTANNYESLFELIDKRPILSTIIIVAALGMFIGIVTLLKFN